jgi:hypothetical protein
MVLLKNLFTGNHITMRHGCRCLCGVKMCAHNPTHSKPRCKRWCREHEHAPKKEPRTATNQQASQSQIPPHRCVATSGITPTGVHPPQVSPLQRCKTICGVLWGCRGSRWGLLPRARRTTGFMPPTSIIRHIFFCSLRTTLHCDLFARHTGQLKPWGGGEVEFDEDTDDVDGLQCDRWHCATDGEKVSVSVPTEPISGTKSQCC